jgi:hypothetical protein
MTMLMTETNTPEMSERIIRAAKFVLGNGCYKTDFEHGQWWVTRPGTYQQWSVVDCQTPGGVDYLDFELVSQGDE